MTVQRGLALLIIGDSCVYNNVLPSSIFEELEDCKSVFNAIINDQVFQKIWVSALYE
jgi:hypothetical protein